MWLRLILSRFEDVVMKVEEVEERSPSTVTICIKNSACHIEGVDLLNAVQKLSVHFDLPNQAPAEPAEPAKENV